MSFLSSLKEIFGLKNKFIIYNLVSRNLKLRYRKSILGIFWTMLIPGITAIVYFLVFQFVMKINLPNYLFFLLLGLIPWTFLSGALTLGLESIVVNHPILNKVPVPPFVFPFSEILTAFLNLLFALPVLTLVALLMDVHISIYWCLFPIYLGILFLMTYFITLTMSVLYVYFRDLRHIVSVLMQLWFYGTPVIYESAMIPEKYQFVLYLNPVALIFHGLHESVIHSRALTSV